MAYEKEFERAKDLFYNARTVRFSWLKSLTLLASALFGVLIALLPKTQASVYEAALLALSVLLLGLGILALSVALHDQTDLANRSFEEFREELGRAIRNQDAPLERLTESRKVYARFRKVAYILLILSVLALSAYTILVAINSVGS